MSPVKGKRPSRAFVRSGPVAPKGRATGAAKSPLPEVTEPSELVAAAPLVPDEVDASPLLEAVADDAAPEVRETDADLVAAEPEATTAELAPEIAAPEASEAEPVAAELVPTETGEAAELLVRDEAHESPPLATVVDVAAPEPPEAVADFIAEAPEIAETVAPEAPESETNAAEPVPTETAEAAEPIPPAETPLVLDEAPEVPPLETVVDVAAQELPEAVADFIAEAPEIAETVAPEAPESEPNAVEAEPIEAAELLPPAETPPVPDESHEAPLFEALVDVAAPELPEADAALVPAASAELLPEALAPEIAAPEVTEAPEPIAEPEAWIPLPREQAAPITPSIFELLRTRDEPVPGPEPELLPSDDEAPARRRLAPPLRAVLAFAVVANLLIVLGSPVPALAPLAGVLFCLVLPIVLLWQKIDWNEADPAERIVISLGATAFGLMAGGLVLNEVLRFAGVARPLDRTPVLIALDLALAVGLAWRPERLRMPQSPFRGAPEGMRLIAAGAGTIVLAIIGAIRLNNGASGSVTVVMLIVMTAVFTLLIARRGRLSTTTIAIVLYELSFAVLLMTSLRGWYVTGHDIQVEFQVFQLTAQNGSWDMSRFQDPYNACMSITILPTVLSRLLHISDPYVFKVVFQAIFAACPVVVFLLARRFASTLVALLATIYFVGFPTFFTDMPFLDRQELAFLFVALGLLVATQPRWSNRRARLWFAGITSGVLLSHYSTNYVFVATLGLAFAGGYGIDLLHYLRARAGGRRAGIARSAPVIGLANIALLACLTFVWSGPITHTSGHLEQTLRSSAESFLGSGGQRSSDTSYSLVAGKAQTAAQRVAGFEKVTLKATAKERATGQYYPLSTVDRFPPRALFAPELGVTSFGRLVERSGLSAETINGLLRTGAASIIQLFVLIGLFMVVIGRATRIRPDREITLIAAASMAVVVSQVILPDLSVEYGLLRAFQQSLIVLAPFLAAGSITFFAWAGRRLVVPLACVMALGFFLSLSGVVPQVLGGYPAQLGLNNAGAYYDIYYTHPQELRAYAYLQSRVAADQRQLTDANVESDLYTFNRLSDIGTPRGNDIFPTLLQPGAYVFLGDSNVTKKISSFTYAGDSITYRYPFGLLDVTKNLIYASNGAQIYR